MRAVERFEGGVSAAGELKSADSVAVLANVVGFARLDSFGLCPAVEGLERRRNLRGIRLDCFFDGADLALAPGLLMRCRKKSNSGEDVETAGRSCDRPERLRRRG